MKKIILLAAVVALTTASCKKERSCSCTVTSTSTTTIGSSSSTSSSTSTNKRTAEKDTKKNFRRDSECFNHETTQTTSFSGGSTTTVDKYVCTLD